MIGLNINHAKTHLRLDRVLGVDKDRMVVPPEFFATLELFRKGHLFRLLAWFCKASGL